MPLIQVPTVRPGREIETANLYVLDVESKDEQGRPLYVRVAIHADAMASAMKAGPQDVWNMIGIEIKGAFAAIKARVEHQPIVAARARHRGREGRIMMIDRTNPLGAQVELRQDDGWSAKVPWAECEYV